MSVLEIASSDTLTTPLDFIEGEQAENYALSIIHSGRAPNLPGKKPFINPELLKKYKGEAGFVLLTTPEMNLEWPLDMIVGAQDFTSWEGRGPHNKKHGILSKDLIKGYASLPTPIPPITHGLDVYIADTGEVYAVSQDAHRTAAAKLRNQVAIEVSGPIIVYPLTELPAELHR